MALVNYERDGQVVTLTLNRPEKLNAFSDELAKEILMLAKSCPTTLSEA